MLGLFGIFKEKDKSPDGVSSSYGLREGRTCALYPPFLVIVSIGLVTQIGGATYLNAASGQYMYFREGTYLMVRNYEQLFPVLVNI